MGDLLPAVVWRVADRPGGGDGGRLSLMAHAVRNGHTLCGHDERNVIWSAGDPGEVPRCPLCHRVQDGYGTAQDLLRLGMTYRQLDFWCRQGYLRADEQDPGSGNRRIFDPHEVEVAARMVVYVAAGIPPAVANRAARNGGRLSPTVRLVNDDQADPCESVRPPSAPPWIVERTV